MIPVYTETLIIANDNEGSVQFAINIINFRVCDGMLLQYNVFLSQGKFLRQKWKVSLFSFPKTHDPDILALMPLKLK